MIISSSLLRLYSRPSANSGQRIRLKRCLEGISLWLAVMLMLFVHPLYAEANETDNVGQFHFVDGQGQWQEPALILESDFDVRISGLIAGRVCVPAAGKGQCVWTDHESGRADDRRQGAAEGDGAPDL